MMPRTNVRRIQRTKKGQWIITVPSSLAVALQFRTGEEFQWEMSEEWKNGDLLMRRLKK